MTDTEKYIRLSYYWKEKDIRSEDVELLSRSELGREVSLGRFRVDRNGKIIPRAKLTEEGRHFVRMLAPSKISRFKRLMTKGLLFVLERTRN